GAQMHLGNAWIMLRTSREGSGAPAQTGISTQSLTVFVEDVQGHYERAKAAGAKIVEEPHETMYGELQYAALDLDGHHWLFSLHAGDVNPSAGGATVASEPPPWWVSLPRPRMCYLEIPAADPEKSADFYEKVFGWNIRKRGSGRPSFDDAGVVS